MEFLIFYGILLVMQAVTAANRLKQPSSEWERFFRLLPGLVLTLIAGKLIASLTQNTVGTDQLFFYTSLFKGWDVPASLWEKLEAFLIGLSGFLLLHASLFAAPYLVLVRLFRLKDSNFLLRWLFFSVAYQFSVFTIMSPVATRGYFQSGLIDEGFGWKAGALYTGYAAIALTLFTLGYDAFKAIDEKEQRFFWSGMAAAIAFGYWGYALTGSLWMAAAFAGYASVWLSDRYGRLLRQPYPLQRLALWVTTDLPFLAVGLISWVLFGIGWVTALLLLVGFGVSLVFLTKAMFGLLPVVARQDWLIYNRTPKPTAEYQRVEKELAALEASALRQRALRQIARHQRLVLEADAARKAGKHAHAQELLNQVLGVLEKVSPLTPEQQTVLGAACMGRARLSLLKGNFSDAERDYQRAVQMGAVDNEMVALLAVGAAERKQDTAAALGYYRHYLQLQRGRPPDASLQKVLATLEGICSVRLAVGRQRAQEIRDITGWVLAYDSRIAWAHRILGQAHMLLNDMMSARSELETALSLQPDHKDTLSALGHVYRHAREFDRAAELYEQSLQVDPSQAFLAHRLGILLLDERPGSGEAEWQRAAHWLQNAAKTEPGRAWFHYDLSRAQRRLGDAQAARGSLETAVRLNDDYPAAHRDLADLLYDAGEYATAVPHYRKALAPGALDFPLLQNLGLSLVESGEPAGAVELLAPLADAHPQLRYPLGRAYLRLEKYPAADDELRRSLEVDPEDGLCCYYLGCTLAWRGALESPDFYPEALNFLERAARLQPDLASRSALQTGHIHLRSQRLEQAIASYTQAAEDRSLRLPASLALARACLANNQPAEAQAALDRLTKTQRNSAEVQYFAGLAAELQGDLVHAEQAYRQAGADGSLGVIFYRQKRLQDAANTLQAARRSGENSDRIIYFSGLCLCELGDYPAAIAEWELLQKRHPDDPRLALNLTRLWYFLGRQHYQQGRYAQAAQAWEYFYQQYSSDEQVRQSLQDMYLLAAFHAAEIEESNRFIQRARSLGAKNKSCDLLSAQNELKAGKLPAAIRRLEALDRRLQDAPVQYNLGVAQLLEGAAYDARAHLQAAFDRSTAELHEHSGWALAACAAECQDWPAAAQVLAGLDQP